MPGCPAGPVGSHGPWCFSIPGHREGGVWSAGWLLALHGPARLWEPERLRGRLFPCRYGRSARYRQLVPSAIKQRRIGDPAPRELPNKSRSATGPGLRPERKIRLMVGGRLA
jgi:hypothetical protein